MNIEMVPHADGGFALVEMRPQTLGIIYDPLLAEEFRAFLDQRSDRRVAEFEPADAGGEVDAASAAVDAAAPAVDAAPMEVPAAPPQLGVPPEIDWSVAFRALEEGNRLRDVADLLGLEWTALRARWAQHKQAMLKEVTTLPAVVPARSEVALKISAAAVANADRQIECSTCGKPFTTAVFDPGINQCARCRRD